MYKNLYNIFSDRWIHNGKVFIYSDPHFSDVESYTFRELLNDDTTVEELDEMQIKNINSLVGSDDTIIFLGDIGNIECIKKIKGYKVLILGNHDKGASYYKREVVEKFNNEDMSFGDRLKMQDALFSHDFESINNVMKRYTKQIDNNLFDEVYEGPLMISNKVILSHEPIEVEEYMFNIHGHRHDLVADYDENHLHLNVCAEAINYIPVCLQDLIKNGLIKHIKDIHRYTIDKRD